MRLWPLIGLVAIRAGAADPILPNPKLTPGDTLPVTVEQLAVKGYANVVNGGVRNVPESLKKQVFIEYFGKVPEKPGAYEVDHLISLEIGGNNSISNLWPQSYSGPWNARVKDKLENRLAANVRNTLKADGHDAATTLLKGYQQSVSHNWTNLYVFIFGGPPVTPVAAPKVTKSVPMGNGKP